MAREGPCRWDEEAVVSGDRDEDGDAGDDLEGGGQDVEVGPDGSIERSNLFGEVGGLLGIDEGEEKAT